MILMIWDILQKYIHKFQLMFPIVIFHYKQLLRYNTALFYQVSFWMRGYCNDPPASYYGYVFIFIQDKHILKQGMIIVIYSIHIAVCTFQQFTSLMTGGLWLDANNNSKNPFL